MAMRVQVQDAVQTSAPMVLVQALSPTLFGTGLVRLKIAATTNLTTSWTTAAAGSPTSTS